MEHLSRLAGATVELFPVNPEGIPDDRDPRESGNREVTAGQFVSHGGEFGQPVGRNVRATPPGPSPPRRPVRG
ncbi:hypothetical protein GCM10022227_17480 [Streptomyces sedi]